MEPFQQDVIKGVWMWAESAPGGILKHNTHTQPGVIIWQCDTVPREAWRLQNSPWRLSKVHTHTHTAQRSLHPLPETSPISSKSSVLMSCDITEESEHSCRGLLQFHFTAQLQTISATIAERSESAKRFVLGIDHIWSGWSPVRTVSRSLLSVKSRNLFLTKKLKEFITWKSLSAGASLQRETFDIFSSFTSLQTSALT